MNKKDRDIIRQALERFQQAQEADAEFRREFIKDLEFVSDDQWEPLARQQRTESSRPCFTVDRINPSLRQIVNEERQNRPSVMVKPTGSGSTEEIARIMQGMIRHIEVDSNADSAYDTAGWYAAAGGVGYLRVRTEYENTLSFNQKLLIEAVADPMTVFFDPTSVATDGSDARWAFIIDTLSREDFAAKYPDIDEPEESWTDSLTEDPDWYSSDSVRVAEYYYRSDRPIKIYQIQDMLTGETVVTQEPPPQALIDAGTLVVLQTRDSTEPVINWCLITSDRILKRSEWLGNHIPVIPVYGENYFVNGRRFKCGAVRRAKDAQKILNYTTSLQTEIIDLNAKAPFIGAAGQFDTFEDLWRDANRKNFGYLEYNPRDINGTAVGPPQRNAFEAPIQSVQATKLMAVDDIKAVFGIFDASLGAQGNETSGVAILARKEQSGISNYHYYDNLVRSVRHLGRILVDVIPEYYDTERVVRIIQPNDEQTLITINQLTAAGPVNDLSIGEYDVVVRTGPSYSTRREEMVSKGLELISAYPAAAPLIADLVAQQMDFEGAAQIARRLRAAVPPEIAAADEEVSDASARARLPQLQSQLQQAQTSLQALNAHAEEVERELAAARDELRLSKLKADVEITKAEMDQNIKIKTLELDEQKTELDFLVKRQELVLQEQQLKLEEAKLAVVGVKTMSEVADRTFEKETQHIERVATMKPGEGETGLGGIKFDAPDLARPSEINKSPSGI